MNARCAVISVWRGQTKEKNRAEEIKDSESR